MDKIEIHNIFLYLLEGDDLEILVDTYGHFNFANEL
jgi:hypothetical protein